VAVVALLAVSARIVGTFAFLTSPQCSACQGRAGAMGPPLSAPLAMGTPSPLGRATNHSYAMSITPSGGIRWGELQFRVQNPTGSTVVPASDWNASVFGREVGTGTPLASYDFPTHEWVSGESVALISGQTIVLGLGGTNLTGLGDQFVVLGPPNSCGCTGSVSVPLP
jgi:hypothetical protein